MAGIDDLRDRIVGQRFYDTEQDESFTVVGITPEPTLALLQYDDGIGWDEAATNFTVNADVAHRAGLDEHGLDSERYRPLGAGPTIDKVCEPSDHEWYPKPDHIWPAGAREKVREQTDSHLRDFYNRFVRCKRCGLSGDVAAQFGSYGSSSNQLHHPPWFCSACGNVFQDTDLSYHKDQPFCQDCITELDEG